MPYPIYNTKTDAVANTDTFYTDTVYFTLISYFAMIIFGQDAGPVGVLIIIEDEKGIALKNQSKYFRENVCLCIMLDSSTCLQQLLQRRGKNIQLSCFCGKK